jgi:hypothetical protein
MFTKNLRSTYYLIVQKSHFIYHLLQPFPIRIICTYAVRDLLCRISGDSIEHMILGFTPTMLGGGQIHILLNVCLVMLGHFHLFLLLCLGTYKEVYIQYYVTRNTGPVSCAVKNCLLWLHICLTNEKGNIYILNIFILMLFSIHKLYMYAMHFRKINNKLGIKRIKYEMNRLHLQ